MNIRLVPMKSQITTKKGSQGPKSTLAGPFTRATPSTLSPTSFQRFQLSL